ncbi:MAG: hypothetical protein ACR2OL_14015, partial [Anderseniella sp.]
MTMNISTLPVLPKGEATHTKRIEDGAAEFDVKMLLKSKMSVNTSWSLEADIEEKSQPVADEQVAPDNTGISPIDMH